MSFAQQDRMHSIEPHWHQEWQWTIIILAALVLCSCRAAAPKAPTTPLAAKYSSPPVAMIADSTKASTKATNAAGVATASDTVMPVSYIESHSVAESAANVPASAWCAPLPCSTCGPLPLPYNVCSTTCHPDELLCDGGDHGLGVMVSPDWKIYGLDSEDTIAHYDTLDGRTLVKPTNCVCIYAPRFGAVRTVARIAASEQIDTPNGMIMPIKPQPHREIAIPASSFQRLQAKGGTAIVPPEGFVTQQIGAPAVQILVPLAFQDAVLPYEALLLQPPLTLVEEQKARLAQSIEAAIAWTGTQALQVTLNGQPASELISDTKPQVTYTVEDFRHPKLCVTKVASTQTAQPGDTVDFTIRFDNVGDQPIGNIVLVDNLTPRLEYVPNSAQSSVKAAFTSQPNDGGSLVLRWEITDPLEKNQGGIVRFRCKVR